MNYHDPEKDIEELKNLFDQQIGQIRRKLLRADNAQDVRDSQRRIAEIRKELQNLD